MLDLKDRIDTTVLGKGQIDKAADQTKDATSGVVDAVKEKMHNAVDGTADFVDTATHKAQEWAHNVGDAAVLTKDKAQEMASATSDTAVDLSKEATDLIRRYPIPAMLLGIGTGFLLAQLLHASTKRA